MATAIQTHPNTHQTKLISITIKSQRNQYFAQHMSHLPTSGLPERHRGSDFGTRLGCGANRGSVSRRVIVAKPHGLNYRLIAMIP